MGLALYLLRCCLYGLPIILSSMFSSLLKLKSPSSFFRLWPVLKPGRLAVPFLSYTVGVSVSFQYPGFPGTSREESICLQHQYKSLRRCRIGRAGIILTLERLQLPLKLIILSVSTAASNPDLGGVSQLILRVNVGHI